MGALSGKNGCSECKMSVTKKKKLKKCEMICVIVEVCSGVRKKKHSCNATVCCLKLPVTYETNDV